MEFCIIHLILSDYNKISPKKKATLKAIIHGKKNSGLYYGYLRKCFLFRKDAFYMLLYMHMVFD